MKDHPRLTATGLQDALAEELRRLFAGLTLPSPSGERAPVAVFPDDLPVPESDDAPDPFPYAVIRLTGGAQEEPGGEETTSVNLLFGCYDRGVERQGHRDVLTLIGRVKRRFQADPALGPYEQTGRVEWAVPEDDPYPYYFGGLQLTFAAPTVTREDEYS